MRIIVICFLCLIATSCYADEWVIDTTTGCKVLNEKTEPIISIRWSGKCEGGIANGQGVLRQYSTKFGSKENSELFSTFEGFLKDGKRSGNGTITGPNGQKFVGEWKDDKMSGKGTFSGPYGHTFVCELKDSKWIGTVTKTYPNGDKFVGEFKDGGLSIGTLTEAKGDTYVGEFLFDQKNGKGALTEANGDQYIGEFKMGKKHGEGKFIFKSGSSYKGLWENGERIKIF